MSFLQPAAEGGDGRVGRVGYVPGVFDMFHVGHLNVLKNARLACDHLIAGVVSDELSLRNKNKTPIVPLVERLEIVRSIRYVDEVVEEDVPEKLDMWRRLRFDVIIKGDDWRGTAKGNKLEADFASVGVEVVYLPYTLQTSSTMLRQALDSRLRNDA
ncbi:glycerol-3-phosphate cytidylyltransferase [Jatrophihabitans endophyticus]|uniref:Glycerol-3-phosphate cytidylyltransferase n=1 Tax=Jatrophihabitans endophyticus TaxID=1206085 RepID=A0A1M5U719_9ACTN|nr:adenylyltransferase/cytidyltransferase family protein [Jatrophihabitans endophyticus]SHH58787.1 glycerol-3-phosphate cytidylyltransferase [Jatrophihabitans endophyticus]